MKNLLNAYMAVSTIITSLAIVFLIAGGIAFFITDGIGETTNYTIQQNPDNDKCVTYIYGMQHGDEEIIWSWYDDATTENFDSVAYARKAKAEKMIKSFEKLNK